MRLQDEIENFGEVQPWDFTCDRKSVAALTTCTPDFAACNSNLSSVPLECLSDRLPTPSPTHTPRTSQSSGGNLLTVPKIVRKKLFTNLAPSGEESVYSLVASHGAKPCQTLYIIHKHTTWVSFPTCNQAACESHRSLSYMADGALSSVE